MGHNIEWKHADRDKRMNGKKVEKEKTLNRFNVDWK
jgi:hypothetical protein